MSDLRTSAQQALEAWDNDENGTMDHPLSGVMEALRAALEQPEQEPVAWRIRCINPVLDWVLMYSRPTTEEKFSNMEVQPLYPPPAASGEG